MSFRFVCFLALILTAMAHAQTPEVHYTLSMPRPATHLLEIEVRYTHLPSSATELDLMLPVWRTGRYLVLDFAGGVQEFSAKDGAGASLSWKKADKTTWRIETRGATEVTARYTVYANEFNLRTRGLNDRHAFVDGTAVFMYAEPYRALPVQLTVKPYSDWHVTTGLDEAPNGGGVRFSAPNYDYFIDCPMEIGNQKDFSFEIDGTPHVLSIFGEGNWDSEVLIKDITKIVKAEKEFWGTEFPYKKYIFMFHCTPSSGGGTEHINSAAMGIRPFVFKNPDSYKGFLGLVSHEYFHTWNVKQLRPKGLDPYNFQKENYTEELWVAEGMTSYYDDLILVRAGLSPVQPYIDRIAQTVANDRSRPGNTIQSVASSSFDAWIKFWKGNQQSYNAEADYYERGAMVSFLLDMEIRKQSAGKSSLDEVMRALYKRFPLSGGGYTLSDFKQVIRDVSGANIDGFFDDFVWGTKPLTWEEHLAVVGLQIASKDTTAKPWLGLGTNDAGDRVKVNRVIAGSPAYTSGIDVGDEIVACNGYRVRTQDINDRISEMKPGDKVTLTIFQNDQLRTIAITLGTAPVPAYKITRVEKPTDEQKHNYETWLVTKW